MKGNGTKVARIKSCFSTYWYLFNVLIKVKVCLLELKLSRCRDAGLNLPGDS